MRVLHISNYYYDRGGDCTYLFALQKLLREHGHDNIDFSMHHPHNFKSDYFKYFVSYINYAEELKRNKLKSALKVLGRSIYSAEARRNMHDLVKDQKPQIAHIQSLHHHLTHSILYPLKENNIPIVWTVHDYALICPNTVFLSHGKVCEKCKGGILIWPLLKKCKKDSLSASAVSMLEALTHRLIKIEQLVDFFITPSEFLKNKLIEYGFNKEKVLCVNNFIDHNFNVIDDSDESFDDYYLYVGRISWEKGIKTLINAALKASVSNLKIVGDGPLKDEMISYVNKMGGSHRIEFLGHKKKNDVHRLIKKSRFIVLPSEWYENFPYSILESFAYGKAVIGSRVGGIPELVKDNYTGVTFKMGNEDELSEKISYFVSHHNEVRIMGQNAMKYAAEKLNGEKHYRSILDIYSRLVYS